MKALKTAIATFSVVLVASLPIYAETSVEIKPTPQASTFDAKSVERDPFLPIGWKRKTIVRASPRQLTITPDAFRITSIVTGGGGAGLAIINGRGFAAGESVMINVGGREVDVLVKEVKDGEVIFLHNGQDIRAPLIGR